MLTRVIGIYLFGIITIAFSRFIVDKIGMVWFAYILIPVAFSITYFIPQFVRIFFGGKELISASAPGLYDFLKSQKITIKRIIIHPSKNTYAYACSFGNNKTIVMSSRMLKEHTSDELVGVVAHELGHFAHKDQIFYSVCIVVYLLLFSLVSYLYLIFTVSFPILLLVSRVRENEADKYTKEVLHKQAGLAMFLKKQDTKGLSLPTILRTHPKIDNRVKLLSSN